MPPIAPPLPIAATAVHRNLYVAQSDCAVVLPSIALPPPLPLPTTIMPLLLPSPIATPTNTHCRRHHRCPLIAPSRSSHAATHPLLSNLTTCQGACW
jgi:hypothetical protein